VWIVGVVERRRRGSEKLESSSFYKRKRGWRSFDNHASGSSGHDCLRYVYPKIP
jgi:hypothetical protein